MADLINIRLTKDGPAVEAMDYVAQNLGMSRNEMIIKSIGMMISFDKLFYKKLEDYSGKMNVSMVVAMQNMIIKRWAQDAGTISPKELHEMAYQITFDVEAKERIAMMEKDIAIGLPPRSEEDKAFYKKYKHKYSVIQNERNEDSDSLAYWESAMTDAEALEKFKGGKGNDKKK